MSKDYERINVLLPKKVVEELRESVPEGERSRFISEATQKKLARLRLAKALKIGAGAWKDEDHPDLNTVEDIHRWLEELRRPGEERMSRLHSKK
ncbi:MAG: hypothetical protein HYX86_05675 [Chloroflexi bacterium]|nr:hypothetical protein [Chloroflexota bacterium]